MAQEPREAVSSGVHFEEESHAIALARARSNTEPITRARSAERAPPTFNKRKSTSSDDDSSLADVEIIDERDFKKKQVFRGWLLMWSVCSLLLSSLRGLTCLVQVGVSVYWCHLRRYWHFAPLCLLVHIQQPARL